MSQYYDSAYASRNAHRHHSRRRALKKTSLLMLVLGLLCVLFSFLLFGLSFLKKSGVAQHKQLVLSLVYFAAGAALLVVRALMELIRNRTSGRRQGKKNGTNDYYMPRRGASEPRPSASPPDAQEGMALVLVLAILALVSGLVLQAQLTARAALRRERSDLLGARLHRAAADGAWHALRQLADDEDLSVDSTNEPWAAPHDIVDPAGVALRIRVTDENRRFDLNNLAVKPSDGNVRTPDGILMDLMTLCGDFAPIDRVEALADWMDADGDGFSERALYRALVPPYEPANRILYSWGELLRVSGFDRPYFAPHERLSANEVYSADFTECFAVIPGQAASPRPVNINTAGKEVLLGIVGLDNEAVVAAILAFRQEGPIRSLAPFVASVRSLAERVRPYMDVGSRFFRVEAQAYAEGQSRRLQALAKRGQDGRVDVLQWVF